MKNNNGNGKRSKLENMDLGKFEDIVKAIKEDHKDLRKFGEILKSEDASDAEKKEAYKNFSSLLKSHAKSEEKAVYQRCLEVDDMKQEADEGFIEHNIADTLMKNISTMRDKEKWAAAVKVLAEVVEHHADEEEKELLPDLNENFEEEDKSDMSHKFVALREQSQKDVTEENAGILGQVDTSLNAKTL